MKRVLFLFLVVLGFLPSPASAATVRIRSLDVEAALERGGRLIVRERILHEETLPPSAPFVRELPAKFAVGKRFVPTGAEVLGLFRGGTVLPYVPAARPGSLAVQWPAEPAAGLFLDQLAYALGRIVVETGAEQQLRWSVNGSGWALPVERASLRFDGFAAPTAAACFVGERSSTGQAGCTLSVSGTQIMVEAVAPLPPGVELWLDLRFPTGTFPAAAPEGPTEGVWAAPWALFTLLFSFFWFLVWLLFGRDARSSKALPVSCEPPHSFKPYEANALFFNGATHRLAAATLFDLARRGLLRLHFGTGANAVGLTEIVSGQEFALDHVERCVWHASQEDALSSGGALRQARLLADHGLEERGWHRWNVPLVRGVAIVCALASWSVCFLVLFVFFADSLLFLSVIGLVVALAFAYQMPKRTVAGTRAWERLAGFRQGVRRAGQSQVLYERTGVPLAERFLAGLPFALALGIEAEWGRFFAGLILLPQEHGFGPEMLSAPKVAQMAHALSEQTRHWI